MLFERFDQANNRFFYIHEGRKIPLIAYYQPHYENYAEHARVPRSYERVDLTSSDQFYYMNLEYAGLFY